MKRKLIFCIFIIFLTSIKCFAQNTDLKYYSDYDKGFSGCSVAVYYGNLSELEAIGQEQEFLDYLDEEIGDKLNSISKLTKNNDWLFRQALREWDYKKGEVYAVFCANSKFSREGIFLIVVIAEKENILWKAYLIDENTNFDDLFPNTEEEW